MTNINSIFFYNLPGMYMGDSYKVGDTIEYETKDGKNKYKLTVAAIADPKLIDPKFNEKYFITGQEVKKDGKLSPLPGVYRVPSLNLANAEDAAQSLEEQIKEQRGKDMEEIKKMASEMGMIKKDGKFKIEGGRRTRRRRTRKKKRRRRTRKKKRRRRTKKKRRRRRRKTRK